MTPKPKCPLCGTPMQRIYIRTSDERSRRHYDPCGWLCSNPSCNFVSHD